MSNLSERIEYGSPYLPEAHAQAITEGMVEPNMTLTEFSRSAQPVIHESLLGRYSEDEMQSFQDYVEDRFGRR